MIAVTQSIRLEAISAPENRAVAAAPREAGQPGIGSSTERQKGVAILRGTKCGRELEIEQQKKVLFSL